MSKYIARSVKLYRLELPICAALKGHKIDHPGLPCPFRTSCCSMSISKINVQELPAPSKYHFEITKPKSKVKCQII